MALVRAHTALPSSPHSPRSPATCVFQARDYLRSSSLATVLRDQARALALAGKTAQDHACPAPQAAPLAPLPCPTAAVARRLGPPRATGTVSAPVGHCPARRGSGLRHKPGHGGIHPYGNMVGGERLGYAPQPLKYVPPADVEPGVVPVKRDRPVDGL